jgi:hypothetical protein
MMFADARVWQSAIHDLKSMQKFLSRAETSAVLDDAISKCELVFAEYPEDIRRYAKEWVDAQDPGPALSPEELFL